MPTATPNHFNLIRDPAQKRLLNDRLFSLIAPRYDLINRLLSFGRDQTWKKRLVALIPEAPAPLCLDLACGTGDIGMLLLRRFPEARVVGVDLTAAMLKLAQRRNRCNSLGFSQQDMMSLAFRSDSFDLVVGGYALRNAPDLGGCLDEIRRVLKPGRMALFLDFSKPAGPFLQRLQHCLLKTWGWFWGYAFHRTPWAYTYIAESLAHYPDRDRLQQLLAAHGFAVLDTRHFFLGFIAVVTIQRVK